LKARETTKVHDVTVDSIHDFKVCELFYRYRYIDELREPMFSRDLLVQKFENTLYKIASYFFYKKQAGLVPSYRAILNRWEKLWFPKDMTAYDMAVQKNDISTGNLASFSNVATAALETFYEDFASDQRIPVVIAEDFLVPLRKDIRLHGKIDLMLKSNDNVYSIIKWGGRQRKPDRGYLGMDFAALKLAIQHQHGQDAQVDLNLYHLASPKNSFLEIEQPQQSDLNGLLYWANKVGDTQIHIPRRGYTTYCKTCPFDEECSKFDGWPQSNIEIG